jgi:hypothetical protein
MALARFYVAWLAWYARDTVRDLWRDIPGPKPVKVLVMTIMAIAFILPGQVDDVIVIAVVRFIIYVSKRRKACRELRVTRP